MLEKIRFFVKKILGLETELPSSEMLKRLKKRGLKIGRNPLVHENCIIDPSHCWHIEIGDDVILAPRVQILAHDASMKMYLDYTKVAPVKIGNRVFIGAGSIILPGVEIGDEAIVGAGSVVTRNVSAGMVVAGNPAHEICLTSDYIKKQQMLMNSNNTFGIEFTLPYPITDENKLLLKGKVAQQGIGFVH